MLKIGIIGAGSISLSHIKAYLNNKDCEIKAIADLNVELAKQRAEEYSIENAYADYHDILNDSEIDAVSIATPTFTHKKITIEALASGKHVLCEKPPALTAEEARECCEAAKKYGKCLMFGLVCRFKSQTQYLKEYIDSGKMGKIISGEAVRVMRCCAMNGWFTNKAKAGGGPLIDSAIHELDGVLYLMGYPRPKTVVGFTSNLNRDLPGKFQGKKTAYVSADKGAYDYDVETMASGFITLDNGACISVKTSTVLHAAVAGRYIDIAGEKAGIRLKGKNDLKILERTEDNCFVDVVPTLEDADDFQGQIDHFVDCITTGRECLIKHEEVITLMEIINALYKSAETGEAVQFK